MCSAAHVVVVGVKRQSLGLKWSTSGACLRCPRRRSPTVLAPDQTSWMHDSSHRGSRGWTCSLQIPVCSNAGSNRKVIAFEGAKRHLLASKLWLQLLPEDVAPLSKYTVYRPPLER